MNANSASGKLGEPAGQYKMPIEYPDMQFGNLKMTTDLRNVYSVVLEKWLKVPTEAILSKKFPHVDCIA